MVKRSCHMPTVYSAGLKAEKSREPWEQDCGSGQAPQFGGNTEGFIGAVVPCLTAYLSGFQKTCPVTEAVGVGLLY